MRRDEIGPLLVFLANGTLKGEERARVEEAVSGDPELQAELEALRSIRSRMQEEEMPQSPGAFGRARLMREIGRQQTRLGWLWPAAAAAVALLALQPMWDWRDDGLRLADGGVEVDSGPVLIVAFSGTATEAEIRALLLEFDLNIVAGPSALGLYRLAARDAAARDDALRRLSELPKIVESVEAEE